MVDNSGMQDLLNQATKMKKDLDKSASFLLKNFTDITKKFDCVREKKTKMNKIPVTMLQNVDKSILIVFDDPNDSDKFYGK